MPSNGQLFPGQGRKRPQKDVSYERLHLDNKNPRLPEDSVGKTEDELLKILYSQFYLDELAQSMSRNGYFDEEPLVGVPDNLPGEFEEFDIESDGDRARFIEFLADENLEFTVVEGNRRLATVKILLNDVLRQPLKVSPSFPTVEGRIAEDLRVLPVIVYPTRDAVVPYLGVRHIVGIEKWDPYAKARYVAQTVEKLTSEGRDVQDSIREVQAQIGDSQQGVLKSYTSLRLLRQAQEAFDFNIRLATVNKFSFLTLALGQKPLREYLGLPGLTKILDFETPVSDENVNRLENLLTWLFGNGEKEPVISESRDITTYLKEVVRHEAAVTYLTERYNLLEAYDRTDGEEKMVVRYLNNANQKLEAVLGMAHRHKTDDVIEQAERCVETAERIVEAVRE